jgi:hypothetical protein
MKNPNDGKGIPPTVRQKLAEIRREDRRVRLRVALLRTAAVFIAAMLVAMIVDWLAMLHNTGWRWTLTLDALGLAVVTFVLSILPLFRRRSLSSIARQADLAYPNLQERLLTLAEFEQSTDGNELRGSAAMLDKVRQQAEALSSGISPQSVVSRVELSRATRYMGVALAALALLFAVNFPQTKVLFERFWTPGTNITMTQLHAKSGDMVVGKGDDVSLEILASGKIPSVADISIRTSHRKETVTVPRLVNEAKFVYALSAVNDSFEYRARAGDGETAWHKVTVQDRPRIADVRLHIVPPAYSHLPTVDEAALPRQTRALEGSQMEVTFKADQPLRSMELQFADGSAVPITESGDHTYRFSTTLTNTITFKPVLTNLYQLDNSAKPTCQINVYQDQPPTVSVLSPNNEITARPDDKVKVDFEARDDFGIAKAEMVVMIKSETNTTSITLPIPLTQEEAGARKIRKQVELDLAKFNLKQGQELAYVVRVTDTKENAAQAASDPSSASKDTSSPEQSPAKSASAKTDQKPNGNLAQSSKSPAANKAEANKNANASQAQANNSKPNEAKPSESKPGDGQKHIAMNAPPPKPKEASDDPQGAKRPQDNMSRRVLDVAQSCTCQPMKIVVDQWGRSFEGQVREKLEIAIDPVIKRLDSLLGQAQESVEGAMTAGLSPAQNGSMENAKDNLRQADAAVSDLKKLCHGTPYAFVSLQLDDIREAHMTPARHELGAVALETTSQKADLKHAQQGDFQIKTAREKLANLTKTYESVKRDTKVADAMQRLAKMHQIFLEDTQAMLGSSKPTLNPMQRKVAEVSDDYTAKMQKLLEEKKKILDELAKILADDPRMLRRFLDVEQLEGTTLRDQMTLLNQRQQALAGQSALWNSLPATNHGPFLDALLISQAGEQKEVTEMTSQMLEKMVTWAPLGVALDKEPFAGLRNHAAEAARWATEAAKLNSPETLTASLTSASNALDQLRQLQAALPGLEWITESKENVSVFEANRLNDTAALITRQSGWIKKMQSIRAGDFAQAAQVDQHRLLLDTTTLGEKLDATAISVGHLSPEIQAKADELTATMRQQILPAESSATDAFGRNAVPKAYEHQSVATNAFARGEKQFDDLLHLIIAKIDAEPPPTDPGANKSLEQILAMLKEEQKACEKLGIPCRPINVQVLKDWMKPGSCSNPGSAQARAAQTQAGQAKLKAEQTRKNAKDLVLAKIEELPKAEHVRAPKSGPKPPPSSWNTLVSKLGDELRQGRDNVPPEQYRQAIEQYFSTIAEKPAENDGGTK